MADEEKILALWKMVEDAGVTAMGSGIIYLVYQTQCAHL